MTLNPKKLIEIMKEITLCKQCKTLFLRNDKNKNSKTVCDYHRQQSALAGLINK